MDNNFDSYYNSIDNYDTFMQSLWFANHFEQLLSNGNPDEKLVVLKKEFKNSFFNEFYFKCNYRIFKGEVSNHFR